MTMTQMTVADLVLTEHFERLMTIPDLGSPVTGHLVAITPAKDYARFRNICEVVIDLRDPNSDPQWPSGFSVRCSYADVVTFEMEA